MKFLKLSLICLIAVSAISLNSCKKPNTEPQIPQELIGRWNAVKYVVGSEFSTEDLEFFFIQFNADKTCLFNLDGMSDDDDMAATFSYADGVIKLFVIDEDDYLLCNVEKLTSTELVLNFPPLEEDDDAFTIHYVKAQ